MQSQTYSVGLFGRLGIGTQPNLTFASLPSPSRSHRADRNRTASTVLVTTTTNSSSPTSLMTTTTSVPSPAATPTTSLTPTAVAPSSPSAPVGAIIGSVIGGFALLSFTVAIGFWKTRRRARPQNNQSGSEMPAWTPPGEVDATNKASEVEGDQGRFEADNSPNSGRLDEERQGEPPNVNTSVTQTTEQGRDEDN